MRGLAALNAPLLLLAADCAAPLAPASGGQGLCFMQTGFSRDSSPLSLEVTAQGSPDAGQGLSAAEAAARLRRSGADASPWTPGSVPLAIASQDTAADGTTYVLTSPGFSVFMELHVPVRLRDLHAGPHGPISKFLTKLTAELSSSGPVSASRLAMLDVRGENRNFSLDELSLLGADFAARDLANATKETIVDVLVNAMEHPGDLAPVELLVRWQAQLADESSRLRQGPLGGPLNGATLRRLGPITPGDGTASSWGIAAPRNTARARCSCFRGIIPSLWLALLMLIPVS